MINFLKSPKSSLVVMVLLLYTAMQVELEGMSQIDEAAIVETIVVDPSGRTPYPTIQSAINYLNAHPSLAIKVKILAGTYREGSLKLSPRNAAATIIEGEKAGKVIISGADVWGDWNEDVPGLFWAEWPYNWGEATYSDWYKFRHDLGKRCEIVKVGGVRLKQVASKDDLSVGKFYVDEANDQLWVRFSDSSAVDTNSIEVSVRGQLFWVRQVQNLVLRNLTFKDASNGPQKGDDQYSVALFGNAFEGDMDDLDNYTEHLLIDNCTFSGMNGAGLTVACYRHISIRNSRFNDNGVTGAGITRIRYATIENCEFNHNNWRIGGYGEFYDWAPAGTKILFADNVIVKDSMFADNLATGLWFDYHNENINITNIVANDNYGAGVYLEASSGPFLVTDSEIRRNGYLIGDGMNHGGILIAESRRVTINNNIIANNGHGQVVIRTRIREGSGGFFSGERFDGSVRDVQILNNVISGKRVTPPDDRRADFYTAERQNGAMIMMTTHGQTDLYQNLFLPTLWSSNNLFSHESSNPLFSTGGDYGFECVTLEKWQELFGMDMGSRIVEYPNSVTDL